VLYPCGCTQTNAVNRDLSLLLERDIRLIPDADPFFEVRFPHSSHLLWLNCSSCHPWILAKKGAGMEAILPGDYCGKCHGKVSYAPETGCYRCHINLRYPEAEAEDVLQDMERARQAPVEVMPEIMERGEEVYRRLCTHCHGLDGDGQGPFARLLDTKPRDFTEGTFKFRTTASGSLPSDFDRYRTITMGIKKISMPSWAAIPSADRWALVHYM
jgi:c(7)-type cytochrome triheme protein